MRFACCGMGVLLVASALSCRRHPLGDHADSGPPVVDTAVVDPGVDAPTDHGAGGDATDARAPIDTADAADVADAPDARDANDAGDANDGPSVPPVPCGALRALTAKGPFTSRHARNLLFSADRRLLVVQAAGPPDDLLLVALPEGVPQMLLAGVKNAEWLGRSGMVLAEMHSTGDLVVAPLDGTPLRTIARNSCAHLAVPDGSRVFAVSDCNTRPIIGKLDEIDVATNTTTPRASEAANVLAVSPSGRFAAYVAHDPESDGIMHVLDGDRDLTLSPAAADAPAFVSGERLLFLTPGSHLSNAHLQVPGTNATSQLVAQDRHFGFRGYRISPDGSRALAAQWPATRQPPFATDLFAIRVDGAVGETLLANDLLPYDLSQLGISPFTFTADGGRVVFMASSSTAPMGVFAVQSIGGDRRQLALGNAFAVSPYADRVAIIETNSSSNKQAIHFVAAATGVEAFTASSDSAVGGVAFVAGDRGLVYVERASPNRLHHVSFVDGGNTTIAAWNRSQIPLGDGPQGEIRTGYPVDPTGCFTIVDSDVPESAGTSLVVLPDAPE